MQDINAPTSTLVTEQVELDELSPKPGVIELPIGSKIGAAAARGAANQQQEAQQ